MLQEIPTQKIKAANLVAALLTLICACPIAFGEDAKKAPPSAKPSPAQAKTSATVGMDATQRGERLFKKHYCVGCHADGNNALMPDRPIKGPAFAKKYSNDAVLEGTIRKGFPNEGMPSFPANQISQAQMKDLILYIRSFTPKK